MSSSLSVEAGPVDVRGAVGKNLAYEDLLEHSIQLKISDRLQVRILDLPTLIALKEALGRDRDKAALPILRRTLEEKQRLGEG